MKGTSVEGRLESIEEEDFGRVTVVVYIDTSIEDARKASTLSRKERQDYFKSPEYLKAKAEKDKKIASLHLGKVTLTQ